MFGGRFLIIRATMQEESEKVCNTKNIPASCGHHYNFVLDSISFFGDQ
jgi:hypothetical protein